MPRGVGARRGDLRHLLRHGLRGRMDSPALARPVDLLRGQPLRGPLGVPQLRLLHVPAAHAHPARRCHRRLLQATRQPAEAHARARRLPRLPHRLHNHIVTSQRDVSVIGEKEEVVIGLKLQLLCSKREPSTND